MEKPHKITFRKDYICKLFILGILCIILYKSISTEIGVAWKLVYEILFIVLVLTIRNLVREFLILFLCHQCASLSWLYYDKPLKSEKKYIENQLFLLHICWMSGMYDRCAKAIDKLNGLRTKMSEQQLMDFQQLYVNYLAEINGYASVREELEELIRLIDNSHIKERKRKKLRNSAQVIKCLAEEEWENAIHMLKDRKSLAILEDVSIAYLVGLCYSKLEEYDKAYAHLKYVTRWGGKTRYVALAKDIIKTLPNEEVQGKRSRLIPMRRFLARVLLKIVIIGVLILATYIIHIFSLTGNSYEEAYSRRYLCNKSGISLLYNEQVGDCEVVILSSGDTITYCLFEKTTKYFVPSYKIRVSYSTPKSATGNNKSFEWMRKLYSDETAMMQGIYEEMELREYVRCVIVEFYQVNELLSKHDVNFVVATYDDAIEKVATNQQIPEIREINDKNGETVYLWMIHDLDKDKELKIEYKDSELEEMLEKSGLGNGSIGKTIYINFQDGDADYLEKLLEPENEKDPDNKLLLLDRDAVEQLIQYMRDNDVRIVPGEYEIPQTSNYEEIMNILEFEPEED